MTKNARWSNEESFNDETRVGHVDDIDFNEAKLCPI